MGDSDDPPASVLTNAQREYLQGEKEYRPSVERDVRNRIRTRVRTAFDDLRLLLEAGAAEEDEPPIDLSKVLADVRSGDVWPLPALLFMWATEHPMNLDTVAEMLSGEDPGGSPQGEVDQITTTFDRRVEAGVTAAFEFGVIDSVPLDVENELRVDVGPPVADATEDELASLPRDTLDRLFRERDLDREEYVRAIEIKLGRETDEE